MTQKINVSRIILEHLKTLIDNRTSKLSIIDLVTFFIAPSIVGVVSCLMKIMFNDGAVGAIVAALAVFAGLLINVLVLLYTVNPVGSGEQFIKEQKRLISQINANMLFDILVSLAAVIFLCITPLLECEWRVLFSGISLCLICVFVLTLLMCLKRLHTLIGLRFES